MKIIDFFKQRDKQLHIFACWSLTLTLALVLPLQAAIAWVLVAGVAKEVWDHFNPPSVADAMDLLADIVGIAAACVCVLAASLITKRYGLPSNLLI